MRIEGGVSHRWKSRWKVTWGANPIHAHRRCGRWRDLEAMPGERNERGALIPTFDSVPFSIGAHSIPL